MVVAGLIVVVIISLLVARVGLAYLDGAHPARRPLAHDDASVIDLTALDANDSAVVSPRRWLLRGFDTNEAATWSSHGFGPDHAFLFRSLDIDATTAARLRAAGLEDSALVVLVEEASFARPDGHERLVELAEKAPQLAPQALPWLRHGVTTDQALSYATAGFTPVVSAPWRAAGWDLDDALPWFVARFEPAAALAWRDHGFAPHAASVWRHDHFGVRQAAEWRRLGNTPEEAREVEHRLTNAGVTIADALQWLDLGFTVDEICAGWPSMASGHDTRSWRAGWSRVALAPADVAAWHAAFDREETMRWLDAGVRDASTARRLCARGVRPEDVARVSDDRLAAAFDAVPVTRDDLLSAAGQLAHAGGSPEIGRRLQRAAAANGEAEPKEVAVDLIEDVLDELERLAALGHLGAPHVAKALARRFERGLIVSALITGRGDRTEAPRAS